MVQYHTCMVYKILVCYITGNETYLMQPSTGGLIIEDYEILHTYKWPANTHFDKHHDLYQSGHKHSLHISDYVTKRLVAIISTLQYVACT